MQDLGVIFPHQAHTPALSMVAFPLRQTVETVNTRAASTTTPPGGCTSSRAVQLPLTGDIRHNELELRGNSTFRFREFSLLTYFD